MTISELIHKLRDTRRAYGDLRVVVFDDWGMRDPHPGNVDSTMIDVFDRANFELKSEKIDVVKL